MIVSLRNALVGNKNPTVDFHVLTLIAKADNTTVKLRKIGSPPTGVSIDYSVDNGTTWVKWEDNAEVTLASIGDAMLVQASNGYTNNGISSSARAYRSLQATSGNLKITGSVLSLVNSDINIALNTNLRQNGFSYLF